jgi:hypothetical protein
MGRSGVHDHDKKYSPIRYDANNGTPNSAIFKAKSIQILRIDP